MYIDDILRRHVKKNVRFFMKSGACFNGRVTSASSEDHIVYLHQNMGGDWLTIIDTRNVESIQIEASELNEIFSHYIPNER